MLVIGVGLAACGPTGDPGPGAVGPSASVAAPSATAAVEPSGTPAAAPSSGAPTTSPVDPASPAAGGATDAPPSANPAAEALAGRPWATATLTDVTTGERFSIAELAGRPLFIEAMAIWCTNCRHQQARFTEAFSRLAPGSAEYVVLTVEPSETDRELARYEADRGFTGRYAVAGRELSRALEAEFGPNVLNPPSVPLVFVSPTGEVRFTTGPESVEEILERAGA
jgi:hypothetical protein